MKIIKEKQADTLAMCLSSSIKFQARKVTKKAKAGVKFKDQQLRTINQAAVKFKDQQLRTTNLLSTIIDSKTQL